MKKYQVYQIAGKRYKINIRENNKLFILYDDIEEKNSDDTVFRLVSAYIGNLMVIDTNEIYYHFINTTKPINDHLTEYEKVNSLKKSGEIRFLSGDINNGVFTIFGSDDTLYEEDLEDMIVNKIIGHLYRKGIFINNRNNLEYDIRNEIIRRMSTIFKIVFLVMNMNEVYKEPFNIVEVQAPFNVKEFQFNNIDYKNFK